MCVRVSVRACMCVRVLWGTILLCKCAKEEVCLAFEQILPWCLVYPDEKENVVYDVMIGW